MYDKCLIVQLYNTYCESGTRVDLEKLLYACAPVVDVIFNRYPDFYPYRDDIRQEVLVKAWMTFQNLNRLKQEQSNPMAFLMMRIGAHTWAAMNACSRQYGIPMSMTPKEREVLTMRSAGASWDRIAQALEVTPETAQVYHSLARHKSDRIANVGVEDYGCTEKVGDESLDPAKRYELKDSSRYYQKLIKGMASRHPNLVDDRDEGVFSEDIQDMFRREIEMEAIL